MATGTIKADESMGAQEDRTFALHALLAYGASLPLMIFLGSRLQFYSLNLGLLVTEVVLIAIPASVVLLVHRKTVGKGLFAPPRPKQAALAVAIGGCAVLIAVYKGIVARKTLVGVDTSGADVLAGISPFLLVVVAPLCEELLFRPVLQNSLARHWSHRTSVLLTALLFALFHLHLTRFAETFVIGLFAGIAFLKTKDVWYPVLIHALCNALGPMLWRWAPHLDVLFNPAASIGLACLALAGCYFLGERSPTPLNGLRQRLAWAAFGTLQSFPAASHRSRLAAPLAWAMVLSLIALLGYGHVVMMRYLESDKLKSKYLVSQNDEWTIGPADEVHVRSELTIRQYPEPYEDLILQLPFSEARLEKVTFQSDDLSPFRGGSGEYRVNLSSYKDTANTGSISVRWSFSLACLAPDAKWGYRVPLKSLVPSDSFSLTVTIAEGSGFRFIGGSGERSRRPFTGGLGRPTLDYGSCGMGVEKVSAR